MPIIGSFGAGSAGGYGQRKGGFAPYFIQYLVVAAEEEDILTLVVAEEREDLEQLLLKLWKLTMELLIL